MAKHYIFTMFVLSISTMPVRAWFPGLAKTNERAVCRNAINYNAPNIQLSHVTSYLTVTTDMDSYLPNKPMQVHIRDKQQFKGLIIQARELGTTRNVGRFSAIIPHGDVAMYNCNNNNDTLLLWSETPVDDVTVTWLPEGAYFRNNNDFSIYFVVSVFTDSNTLSPNKSSEILQRGFETIDVSGCGKSKGCFRYSLGKEPCDQDTCEYLFTYRVLPSNEVAEFEMSSKNEWAAIGFSSDDEMGADDIIMCLKGSTVATVEKYWSVKPDITPKLEAYNPTYNKEAAYEDGRILCRFQRPLKVDKQISKNLDLNTDWYQLYAWGQMSTVGTIVKHELESPPTSERKIMVLEYIDVIDASNTMHSNTYCITVIALVLLKCYPMWDL